MALHYPFPLIQHIDHVLPHVDEDCFKVIAKDCGNTYINYVKMGPDTFPDFQPDLPDNDTWNLRAAIRRECRGIAFHTRTGALRSRPFHKFFNVGENWSMDIPMLRFDEEHWVQDKVDGSMLRPIWTEMGMRWGTKMGITDTAMIAETWLIDHPEYASMAEYCIEHGYTPVFEFTSPENQIVVDYGEPNMILLGIRHNDTGEYFKPDYVAHEAKLYGIPSVKMYDPVEGDPAAYIQSVRDSDDLDEGIVIQWWNGHRAKAKTETYSILHRVKESARTERTFITALLAEEVDDLMPMLPEDERGKLTAYIERFWRAVATLEDDIAALFAQAQENWPSKKDFAIGTADSLTSLERKVVFARWDGKIADGHEAAMQIVNSGLVSETKWDEMKQNIAMATSFHDFATGWKQEDNDYE